MSEEKLMGLNDLFFPDQTGDSLPSDIGEGSEGWNELRGSLKKEMPKVAWKVVGKEIAVKLQEVLGIKLDKVLAPGWQKMKSLQEYRDPSRHPPGESALVPLVEHTIESHHRPHLDIVVRDAKLASINLEVDLELLLEGVMLKV